MKNRNTLYSTLALGAAFGLAPNAFADFNTLESWGNAVGTDPPPSFTNVGGEITIASGGADIWGGSDQGSFLWDNAGTYTTTGNFTASVRNVSIANPAPEWGRTGPMVRATQSPGAVAANDAAIMATRKSNGQFITQWRDTAGGDTGRDDGAFPPFPTGNVATTPLYQAIARDGNVIRTGYALDLGGTAGRWVQHGNRDVAAFAAGTQVVVGLGHHSHPQTGGGNLTGGVNVATFDNFAYEGNYNASFFGAGASEGTWMPQASLNVNSNTGAVTGRAFIMEGGVATGEATGWSLQANRFATTPTPGLRTDIYLAGNPGSQAGARSNFANLTPNGSTVIPNVNWTGGNDDPNNYFKGAGDVPYRFDVVVPGQFGGNQENYGVRMRGEIFIPADGDRVGGDVVRFKDGIDDYTFLAVNGQTLIDDNNWTGYDGSANGGSPIVSLDVSDAKYDDGEWVAFEMISWEGGGGDAGALYWDALDGDGNFPTANDQVSNVNDIVPAANFRHFEQLESVSIFGFDQVGNEGADGDFGLTLSPGNWEVSLNNVNTGASANAGTAATVIPEPGVFSLIALSGLGLIFRRRR